VIFFPAKIFSGILEKGNLFEQKKFLAGKNSLSKKVFSLSKKGFRLFDDEVNLLQSECKLLDFFIPKLVV
jgi:hypothetical protein